MGTYAVFKSVAFGEILKLKDGTYWLCVTNTAYVLNSKRVCGIRLVHALSVTDAKSTAPMLKLVVENSIYTVSPYNIGFINIDDVECSIAMLGKRGYGALCDVLCSFFGIQIPMVSTHKLAEIARFFNIPYLEEDIFDTTATKFETHTTEENAVTNSVAIIDYENKASHNDEPSIDELRAIEAEEKRRKDLTKRVKSSCVPEFKKPEPTPTKKNSEATLADLFNSAVPERLQEATNDEEVMPSTKQEETVIASKESLNENKKVGTDSLRVSLFGRIANKPISNEDLILALKESNTLSKSAWCKLYDVGVTNMITKVESIRRLLVKRGVDLSKYNL